MVALDRDRPLGGVPHERGGAGVSAGRGVFLHQDSVDQYLLKGRVAVFLTGLIVTRGTENNFHRLPLTGRLGCIYLRRDPAEALLFLREGRIPALVDPAEITGPKALMPEAIQDLHFIAPCHIDPGVGVLRNHELKLNPDIAELLLGHQIRRGFLVCRVDQDFPRPRELELHLPFHRLDFLHPSPDINRAEGIQKPVLQEVACLRNAGGRQGSEKRNGEEPQGQDFHRAGG